MIRRNVRRSRKYAIKESMNKLVKSSILNNNVYDAVEELFTNYIGDKIQVDVYDIVNELFSDERINGALIIGIDKCFDLILSELNLALEVQEYYKDAVGDYFNVLKSPEEFVIIMAEYVAKNVLQENKWIKKHLNKNVRIKSEDVEEILADI